MKIIEALKQVKDLVRKSSDIKQKIAMYCADMDYETPVYADQKTQVAQWLQSYKDIVREIGRLKYCIQKTNVTVRVTIVIDGNEINKSIAEWIDRRRSLAELEKMAWAVLSNKGLKDLRCQQSTGQIVDAKVRYYYDPKEKDRMIEILSSEPNLIDGKLEIVNAITDLVE